ncbi:hypothetical protein PFICI_00365 [Pestalotiopsis fici W106-1]|uniref:Uncharacterized protein n=1 Tax=Pestalotiopsis fici (strain W106-1 / CGMCC3.15140) TaxID=1229662 RepID=W3XM26_PESFW|nr:uncharacterized protein PFICI_00365 [Pestalotiopsis fici W106-1]ETS86537.1 hypothetical protein PFICI_00365 [Pestalotiopsis fici W106-1]
MHGNNWKEIGALELPDRSAHDIRNRSLLLERRSRNKAIQPPSPNRDLDPTIGKLADADAGEESENDDGSTHNEHSEHNAVDSLVPQNHQVIQGSVVEHYAITAPESMDCNSIERLRYAVPSSDAGQGIQEPLGFGWTGSQEHLQSNSDLLTPESACISWLDPFQASVASNFASPQYQWWSGTPTDELGFQNTESLDLGYFSLPEGDGNPSSRESVQDSLDLVDDSPHDNPDVARRIIGSVLEHGEGHKIRYSFNAT